MFEGKNLVLTGIDKLPQNLPARWGAHTDVVFGCFDYWAIS